MKKFKPKYLSIKEIQEVMRQDDWMPTAIFSATHTEYGILPAKTIFKKSKKNKNLFKL